ncbi:MAG: hypothetical protein Q8M65_05230, partial [Rhodoglobus sp.]|nr:hypothetical protein [Rhodoglobus sp.]
GSVIDDDEVDETSLQYRISYNGGTSWSAWTAISTGVTGSGTSWNYSYSITDAANGAKLLQVRATDTTSTPVVAAGSFVTGSNYRIVSVGTTDYTLIGASANTVGIVFTATGAGSGDGTAKPAASTQTSFTQDTGAPTISGLSPAESAVLGVDFTVSGSVSDATGYVDTLNYKVLRDGSQFQPASGWASVTVQGDAAATALVNGTTYTIISAGTTTWTAVGAADNNVGTVFTATGAGSGTGTARATVSAGSFEVGRKYTIKTAGDTTWTSIGAADNNPGTIFVSTGTGSGTGVAYDNFRIMTFTTPTISTTGGTGAYQVQFETSDGSNVRQTNLNVVVDKTAPTVSFDTDYPLAGSTKNNTITVQGSSYDARAVGTVTVDVYKTGAFVMSAGTVSGTTSWTMQFNTANFDDLTNATLATIN